MSYACPGVIVVAITALLTGCASYESAAIDPAQHADAIQARSLDDPQLQKFIAAATGWNEEHDRSTRVAALPPWDLTRLTLAALYYHPNLDIARAKLAEARAGVITARQSPNPSLSFEELSYNASVATPSPWTIAPIINFLIETFGKREYRTAAAQALVEAARDDLATASWQVREGVRTALLSLWAAQGRLTLLRQRLDLQDQLATLLEHRFAVGEASALDVARERTSRNQISLAVRDAERQAIDARAQLAAAIGIPLPALDGVSVSFDAFEKPERPVADITTATMRRDAFVNRPDVQGLLAEYASAESALQLQIANQYPNITLTAGYIYDAGRNKYQLYPGADLPIFNQNQGPIAQAATRREAVAARFTALQTQIIDAVDGAAANYRAATRAFTTADVLLAGEVDREHRMLRSFQAGAVDRPTLVTARLERVIVEQSRFDAMVQQRQTLGAVEDALQHSFFVPAIPVSPEKNPRAPAEPGR
jgi:outer membrane protein, heavy metal efflux system